MGLAPPNSRLSGLGRISHSAFMHPLLPSWQFDNQSQLFILFTFIRAWVNDKE